MAVKRAASPVNTARSAVLGRMRERSDDIVERTVERIWTAIPAYGAVDDRAFRGDVRQHILSHHQALVRVLERASPPTPEDLLFTRRHTAARVGRIHIADYMKAFRTYQDVIWGALLEEVRDEASRRVALGLVGPVLDYVNLATTYAAELYIEIEQLELAGGERVRRDLLEDLVAGRPVAPGQRQDAAREAGLGPATPCLVVVALARGSVPAGEQVLRSASGALARACGGSKLPLTVLRRDEITIVAAVRGSETGQVIAGLQASHGRLAAQRVRLAIGVSTVHPGLSGVTSAYREARGAAESVGAHGGVLALPARSAFDYLISFRDETAQRLVSPAVRQFVQDDLDHGGILTSTLVAYVDSNLNEKAMSKRLFIHSNTAHYRLNRIAEQTGLDLRKLDDVMGMVVAIRLAQPLGDRPPGVWG